MVCVWLSDIFFNFSSFAARLLELVYLYVGVNAEYLELCLMMRGDGAPVSVLEVKSPDICLSESSSCSEMY